tara:strand:- start:2732 stop:3247 length:516 start_codon:yes stop_codon:yes gene_type:complete
MKSYLLIFSTVDGHTKKILQHISNNLKERNKVELFDLDSENYIDFSRFDFILIGASIRYGNYRNKLFSFIEKNFDEINKKDNAFFSVNVVARKEEKNSIDTNPYIKKFLKRTKWRPNKMSVFAGVVDYPNYKFFDKHIIRLIMYITNGPTDVSKTYEFTDWDKVDEFSSSI